MQDETIIALFWQRDESAIGETERKYGGYLHKIAYNILGDVGHCQETVNDTLFKAWNSIPPNRPSSLSAFLARIARQTAIDRFRALGRKKRGSSSYAVTLCELEECLSAGDSTAEEVDAILLGEAVGRFLKGQKKEVRTVFVSRYFFADSVKDIALSHGISEGNVSTILHRTRASLRTFLQKEGLIR